MTEETFIISSTKDLVELCSVDADDPNATAAIHMCHGYMSGLNHFHMLIDRSLEGRYYCLEDQEKQPTRSEAIVMLVAWSKDNPQHDSLEAANAFLISATETFPCSE